MLRLKNIIVILLFQKTAMSQLILRVLEKQKNKTLSMKMKQSQILVQKQLKILKVLQINLIQFYGMVLRDTLKIRTFQLAPWQQQRRFLRIQPKNLWCRYLVAEILFLRSIKVRINFLLHTYQQRVEHFQNFLKEKTCPVSMF